MTPGSLSDWQAVARQVLAGEWPRPDDTTRVALVIGLRGWPDETCQKAVARLTKPAKAKRPPA